MDTYTIKFDPNVLDEVINEYKKIIENVLYFSNELYKTADTASNICGFGIEEITSELFKEIRLIEQAAERISTISGISYKIIEIYEQAEHKIKKDIYDLPILIHGNISATVAPKEIFSGITYTDSKFEYVENALLYDNTVMHEDWLIKLIAKNKFGG